jgi:hypothetical protein
LAVFIYKKIKIKGGNEMDQFSQLIQDLNRVTMVLGVFYIMTLICIGLKWLLNWLCELAIKGCKAVWKFKRKVFNKTEDEVILQQNEEV